MHPVIRATNVGKSYRVRGGGIGNAQFGYRTLREDLVRLAKAPLRWLGGNGDGAAAHDFWALRDVNFEINPGEVIGVIGRNGAGKSTLLKILSRITLPSKGEVRLRGRVGSLLEVGTGFHPELTGRENIFLNGSILGMRRHEIVRKFDEIVEFAEIGQFLDTPVKRYSSGMYVRLAFAVAAHLEPEILLVDEVLAVGDFSFQRKCLGRMRDVGRSGSTILFVSHNMPAVEALCTRAILMEQGKVAMEGSVHNLVQEYHRRVLSTQNEKGGDLNDLETTNRPNKVFRSVSLLDEAGQPTNFVRLGGPFHLRLGLDTALKLEGPMVTVCFDDCMGQRVLSLQTPLSNPPFDRITGRSMLDCRVDRFPLAPGDYWIKLTIEMVPDEVDEIDRVLRFTVTNGDAFGSGRGWHTGLCVTPSEWAFQQK